MNLPTQAERDLYDYLSPEGKAKVEEHYAGLEVDPPNECPNCNVVIGDHDSFCSKECERQFNGTDELISRPDFVLDEDEGGTPGERLARDGYCEIDEDRLRDQEQDR